MDASAWDERYAATARVWSAEPNQWVAEICADLAPGRALDLAAGEGRNAIWLAERGWEVVATDFSRVAIDRLRSTAEEVLGQRSERVRAYIADAADPLVGLGSFDLVVVCYLQLPEVEWSRALRAAVDAAAPDGWVVIVLHARQNLADGWGGPKDPAVLHDPDHVVAAVEGLPVHVERADLVTRVVRDEVSSHDALDTVVVLRRNAPGSELGDIRRRDEGS